MTQNAKVLLGNVASRPLNIVLLSFSDRASIARGACACTPLSE
jgi:hypothetical protein